LRADPDLLPAAYLLIAAGFALGAGTHGGNHNHFVETVVVAIYCAALFAHRLMVAGGGGRRAGGAAKTGTPAPGPRSVVLRALGLAVVLALSAGLAGEARFGGENWLLRDFRTPRPLEREGWQNVAAFVTNDPGPVYADNVGLLLIAGKEVRY